MERKNFNPDEPKYSYEIANTAYAVSNHTAVWITAHKDVQKLWSEIYDLIVSEDNGDVDEIFDAEFMPHLTALLHALEKRLSLSVVNALYENTETINI